VAYIANVNWWAIGRSDQYRRTDGRCTKCTGIQVVVQKLTKRNRHNTTDTGEDGVSPGETGPFLAHMLDLYVIDHVPTSAPAHITEMHGCVCTSWLMASYRCKQKHNVHGSCPYAQPMFAALPNTYRGGTPGRRFGHLPARRALHIASRLGGRRRFQRRFRSGYGLCCVLRGDVGCLSRLMR
jgi:hypothetical protein